MWYVEQEEIKCTSSSMPSWQRGQMPNSFSSFLCRPVSIINLWFEILNFDICILIFGFLISDKYFSNPILFLKVAYVLNLLPSSRMHSNAFWWNASERVWKIRLFTKQGLSSYGFIKKVSIPFSSKSFLMWITHGSFSFKDSLYDSIIKELALFFRILSQFFIANFLAYNVKGTLPTS